MIRILALTFHDIVGNGHNGSPKAMGNSFYQLPASAFEELLSKLRKAGYRTVSSRSFRAWQEGAGTLPERTVVLTFDDGYASHFEVVAPLLLRYRFSGTFFVTVDWIGRPGYVNWDQLRKLIFLGMEVGSHGMSHRYLPELSAEELDDELTTSKRILEQRLGVPVRAIAAPGGFWNGAVADAVKRAGYEAAWISAIGMNGRETQPMALRRVVVRPSLPVDRIVSMASGWEPSFWWATNQQLLIRALKRVLGVYWYERLKQRLAPNA